MTTDRDGIARAVTYSEKDANNNLFVLSTYKYSSGLIVSRAMEHTDAGNGALTCDVHGCRQKLFARVQTARVTAAKIQEVHTAAVQLFEQWLKELAEAEPVYKVEPGQIVTASTRYADDGKRYALVTVDMLNCKCVALDGSCFNYFARPHNEKDGRQGIGIYYREGEKVSPEELQELIRKAEAAEAAEAQEEARRTQEADQAKGEQAATTSTETATAPAGTIQIVEHPKRAGKILVIGETYTIRHTLKSLGGWWNKWEKGWEFKADMIDEIARALQPKEETTPEPESAPEPELTAPEVEQAHKDAEPDRQPVTPQVAAPWSEHGKGDYVPAELLPKLIDRIIAMNPAADESSDKAPIVSATADKMEATAAKLVEMAADHREQMQAKLQEIQKEADKIQEIATQQPSRQDPKSGRTNTSLPSPQLFLMF